MVKFSVVLIAKNEEQTLPRLLTSLKGIEDIVLVDTGSIDQTITIAESFGVRVFAVGERFVEIVSQEMADKINELPRKYKEDDIVKVGDKTFNYSNARNYAATLAKYDMIFMPDCDEEVTWNIEQVEKEIKGVDRLEYEFVFAHDENGRPMIQFIHSKFYNRTKFKWVRNIHEILEGSGSSKYLAPNIIKLEHWQNESSNRDHYLRGLAIDCLQNPYNDRNTHYFGRELMYKNRFKSAIEILEKHITMPGWLIEQAQSLNFIGECYVYLGELENAKMAYHRAINKFPLKREAYFGLADIYFSQNQFVEATAFYSACLRIPKPNFYATHTPTYEDIPHANLAIALWRLGERDEAFIQLQKALEFSPNNPLYLKNLRFSIPTPVVTIYINDDTIREPINIKANYPNYKIIKQDTIIDKYSIVVADDMIVSIPNGYEIEDSFIIKAVWDLYKRSHSLEKF